MMIQQIETLHYLILELINGFVKILFTCKCMYNAPELIRKEIYMIFKYHIESLNYTSKHSKFFKIFFHLWNQHISFSKACPQST